MTRTCQKRQLAARKVFSSAALAVLLLAGCARLPFDPTPVVPTTSPLPYSAKVKVGEIGTFEVEPGASLSTDPNLQNHVKRTASTLLPTRDPAEWERATVQYLTSRKTFRKVVQEGAADLDLTLQIHMYVDPGLGSGFSHIYLAITNATLSDPQTGRSVMSYTGFGKKAGETKDTAAMEQALLAAFGDVFGKMENDKRLLSL